MTGKVYADRPWETDHNEVRVYHPDDELDARRDAMKSGFSCEFMEWSGHPSAGDA